LGGILDSGLSTSIHKFLQKHLPEDAIGFFSKHGGEYNGDAISGGLHVNGLLIAVVDLHQVPLSATGCLEILLVLESKLKGGS